jgi:dolichol-phosphate mannosyltransferase
MPETPLSEHDSHQMSDPVRSDADELVRAATSDDMQRMYRHRFDESAREAKAAVWRAVVEAGLQRWVPANATVLDIGCGYGEFLNHVRAARRIGVDLNPDARSALAPGIEFHVGDVRRLPFLPDESIDVAFTSNLLEHLPSKKDVEVLLREARRVLKRGGHLILLGPNLRFVPGAYWDFWDHLTPITERSLVEVCENLGFRTIDCIPRWLPYTTRSALPQAPWLVRLYLRMPLIWPVLGRQFLVRVQKL